MVYPEVKPLSPDLQALQHSLAQQCVKYALASFVDIHGMCKGKVVPLSTSSQVSPNLILV